MNNQTITHEGKVIKVINAEDSEYFGNLYLVSLSQIVVPVAVYADCAQTAIDVYADYAYTKKWWGLFLDEDDVVQNEDDVYYVGNNSLPVYFWEIYVEKV